MKSKVLIIDDTPEYIGIVDTILNDHELIAAKEGAKGIALAEKYAPDLILLDINMPIMNGYEVCRRIKQNPLINQIPIIFLTANEGVEFEEVGLELGAVDYISKPFNASILKARVNTHLKLYKLQANLQEEVKKGTDEIQKLNHEITLISASIAELKSKETSQHLKRVSHLSSLFATLLGRPEHESTLLKLAAIMHDIGKVGIPDEILNKPSKLTNTEWEIMKNHSMLGYTMLKDSEFEMLKLAATIALDHHERWDGTGYPAGKKEGEISFWGRLVSIIDVFDSLLDKRVYKDPWPPEKVRSYFENAKGTQFDPDMSTIFLTHYDYLLEERETMQRSFT
jgi:putative two-component system response regulator